MGRRHPINTTSSDKMNVAENRRRAIGLRKEGSTIQEIADHLELAPSTIHGYLKKTLQQANETAAKTAAEWRDEITARKLRLLGILEPLAEEGSMPAFDRIHKIDEQLCKIHGVVTLKKSDRKMIGKKAPGTAEELVQRLRDRLATLTS